MLPSYVKFPFHFLISVQPYCVEVYFYSWKNPFKSIINHWHPVILSITLVSIYSSAFRCYLYVFPYFSVLMWWTWHMITMCSTNGMCVSLLGQAVDSFEAGLRKSLYMWGGDHTYMCEDHMIPVPYKVRGTIKLLFHIRYGGIIRVIESYKVPAVDPNHEDTSHWQLQYSSSEL